ncbi:MAG: hypothetical protein BWZ10_03150 [candidate division BRC1 bacterium ADurb.BinA364]|nr:MAG: hypothetical protein BWZ10_03150 [candidate division BRC1 bacterium ADurb.BinA364]
MHKHCGSRRLASASKLECKSSCPTRNLPSEASPAARRNASILRHQRLLSSSRIGAAVAQSSTIGTAQLVALGSEEARSRSAPRNAPNWSGPKEAIMNGIASAPK